MDTVLIKRYYVANTIIEMKHGYNKSVNLHHCFEMVTTATAKCPVYSFLRHYTNIYFRLSGF